MLNLLRKCIPERSPIRLKYHHYAALLAAFFYRFPGHKLKVIAVTGTSGKSTTVEMIHYLMQNSGIKTGSLSGIFFRIGDKKTPNETLRTTLSPWQTQKWLRAMVRAGCEYVVLEVSSHAIDQHRLWGVPVDTAVLTNIYDNEHLDYHVNFAEYVRTKTRLFRDLNTSMRKPNVDKIMILNRDDAHVDVFEAFPVDKIWDYSTQKNSNTKAENLELRTNGSTFQVHLPNHNLNIKTPIIGRHNVANVMAALATVSANGLAVDKIESLLADFPGIEGRLEVISVGQDFSVIVDFSYKPSGLEATLKTLQNVIEGRLICIWGGAGGRDSLNHQEAAKIISVYADEFILTTDDPLEEDPKAIARLIREVVNKEEGDGFFEIEDRYEAIRYGVFAAEKGDCVLIAGRGHEAIQTIGTQKINFDDRVIAREILEFAKKEGVLDTTE